MGEALINGGTPQNKTKQTKQNSGTSQEAGVITPSDRQVRTKVLAKDE